MYKRYRHILLSFPIMLVAAGALALAGSLDLTFDADGLVTTDFNDQWDVAYAIATQPDGKIVVAGESFIGNNTEFGMARYDSDSSLDTSLTRLCVGGIIQPYTI